MLNPIKKLSESVRSQVIKFLPTSSLALNVICGMLYRSEFSQLLFIFCVFCKMCFCHNEGISTCSNNKSGEMWMFELDIAEIEAESLLSCSHKVEKLRDYLLLAKKRKFSYKILMGNSCLFVQFWKDLCSQKIQENVQKATIFASSFFTIYTLVKILGQNDFSYAA